MSLKYVNHCLKNNCIGITGTNSLAKFISEHACLRCQHHEIKKNQQACGQAWKHIMVTLMVNVIFLVREMKMFWQDVTENEPQYTEFELNEMKTTDSGNDSCSEEEFDSHRLEKSSLVHWKMCHYF